MNQNQKLQIQKNETEMNATIAQMKNRIERTKSKMIPQRKRKRKRERKLQHKYELQN